MIRSLPSRLTNFGHTTCSPPLYCRVPCIVLNRRTLGFLVDGPPKKPTYVVFFEDITTIRNKNVESVHFLIASRSCDRSHFTGRFRVFQDRA